jgi:hypothetical protein
MDACFQSEYPVGRAGRGARSDSGVRGNEVGGEGGLWVE